MKAMLLSLSFVFLTIFNISFAAGNKDAYSLNQIAGFESFSAPEDIQEEDKKVIFYFTAAWCGPCQSVFPKVEAFVKANNSEYKLVLAQYKNQDEIDAGHAMFGNHQYWPFGYVLNSKKDVRDNGESVIIDVAGLDRFKTLTSDETYQNYVPYMLFAITGDESFR